MALTIHERPTTPNYSVRPLVYNISSTNQDESEFIVDVEITVDGDTFKYQKQLNPSARAIIDVSKIIDTQLEPPISGLGVTTNTNEIYAYKTFTIVFKETYVNSAGIRQVGVNQAPAVPSESNGGILKVVKGVWEPNQSEINSAITIGPILSNHTKNIKVYREDTPIISSFASSLLTHRPISLPNTASTYSTTIAGQTITFDIYDTLDNRGPDGEVQFWWTNRRGGLDFFNARGDGTLMTNVNRTLGGGSEITHGYDTVSNKNPRNTKVFNRSTVTYAIDANDMYSKDTGALTTEESDLLRGMLLAPDVFIFDRVNETFIPINVTNRNQLAKVLNRRIQTSRLTIEYQKTNNVRNT